MGFAFLLLLTKRSKKVSDSILLVWILLFGVHLITINFFEYLSKSWFYINEVAAYLHGAFLFCYVRSLLKDESQERSLIFQVLAIAVGVVLLIFLVGDEYWSSMHIVIPLKSILFLTYIILAVKTVRQGKKSQLNAWIYTICIGLLLLTIVPVFHFLLDESSFISSGNGFGNIAYCSFIIILVFVGIRITPIFLEERIEEQIITATRYANSDLSTDLRAQIFQQVEQLVIKSELFLNPNLSLKMVSDQLDWTINQVSESINLQANQNFRDYINSKRIERFKQKIEDKAHLQRTILSLALESGFNSKSSFNRAFQKQTGLTPSQYISAKTENDT